mgnify:CR=1 FL=1
MNEFNQILLDYLSGLPIITIPLSLFAVIALLSGLSQVISNERPQPVTNKLGKFGNFTILTILTIIATSQIYMAFK